MVVDAEKFDRCRHPFRHIEQDFVEHVNCKDKNKPKNKCDHLVVGKAGGKKPYRNVDSRHEHQTKIAAYDGTVVDASQRGERNIIEERGQHRESDQRPRSQEFSEDDFSVGKGLRRQQLYGACLLLLGQKPHCDGGNNEQEDHRNHFEHGPHRSNIHQKEAVRKEPAHNREEYDDHNVGDCRVKVRTEFLPEDRTDI